jgi:hypothetical protein
MSAAAYTIVRYLISFGAGWLANHGWAVASADGPTLDAVTQLAIGSIGLIVPAAIGVMTTSVDWMLARLQARHKTALVAEAAKVPGVQSITADAALADAIPSSKVVAS